MLPQVSNPSVIIPTYTKALEHNIAIHLRNTTDNVAYITKNGYHREWTGGHQ